jgi:hypothetical protein
MSVATESGTRPGTNPAGALTESVGVLLTVEPTGRLRDALLRRGIAAGSDLAVVAPALASHLGLWTDEERWHQRAQRISSTAASNLTAAGFVAHPHVGDADPLAALEDLLRTEHVTRVLVVGSQADCDGWIDHDLLPEARTRFEVPIESMPVSATEASPSLNLGSHHGRIAVVALGGVVVALGLALLGAGRTWLLGELAIVLGIVAVDIVAHVAVLSGALWFAIGPLARRIDRP